VTPPAGPLYKLEDAFLRWPLPPGADAYGWLDGKRMHRYVVEQAEIARRYRDAGHPQFWGRITGTSGDAESAEWMMEKFRRFGLTDVRMQPHDPEPQWMPRWWTVTAGTSGRSLPLGSAQLSGHHNNGNESVGRLMANRDKVFAKTALVLQCEHTSTLQTYFYGEQIRRANTYTAQLWYAGGPSRPKLQDIAVKGFREFGVSTYAEPERTAPPTDMSMMDFWRYVPGVSSDDYSMLFHTDAETPETVPWTGLEATTRAYARIVNEVNKLPLSDFQRAPELPPTSSDRP
jgi:hypothetical protein